jgi:hypothetical protein
MYVKRIIAYLWGSRACSPKGGGGCPRQPPQVGVPATVLEIRALPRLRKYCIPSPSGRLREVCGPSQGGLRRMSGQKLLDGPSQGGLRRMSGQKLLDGPSQGGLRRMSGQKLLDGPSQGGLRRMSGQKLLDGAVTGGGADVVSRRPAWRLGGGGGLQSPKSRLLSLSHTSAGKV